MQVDFEQVLKSLAAAHNMQLICVAAPFDELKKFDYGLRMALDPQMDWENVARMLLEDVPSHTLVLAEDIFELNYALFTLPDQADAVYIIGPWITQKRSQGSAEWCRKHLGEKGDKAIQQFYNGVCMMNNDSLCVALSALLSMVYEKDTFRVVQKKAFRPFNFEPDIKAFQEPSFERDLPATMLEQRYAAEAAMMDAVSQGNFVAALTAFEQLMRFRLESRFTTPLRDAKTTLLISNVLLRKAIQRSAVHPYYIDKISARYAVLIENMSDAEKARDLMIDMLREYCAYVQQYSLQQYSPLVQKVLNHINLNLNTSLSLKSLANMCFISPSYLSYLFKQETGQTLTDYINTQRVERAAHRLLETNESVAEIAEQVGILDVNYFTKIFKKSMGVTPTAYRKQLPK